MRISSSGVIHKAYENDGVHFPSDAVGHRGPAGLQVLDRQSRIRSAGHLGGIPAIHRYGLGHVLVHCHRRSYVRRRLLGQRRNALRRREVDAWAGDQGAVPISLPRPDVLPAAACATGRPLGGQGLAQCPGALPPVGGHAAVRVPGRGRHRSTDVPGPSHELNGLVGLADRRVPRFRPNAEVRFRL